MFLLTSLSLSPLILSISLHTQSQGEAEDEEEEEEEDDHSLWEETVLSPIEALGLANRGADRTSGSLASPTSPFDLSELPFLSPRRERRREAERAQRK